MPHTAIWRAWQALATLYSICLIDFSASTSSQRKCRLWGRWLEALGGGGCYGEWLEIAFIIDKYERFSAARNLN